MQQCGMKSRSIMNSDVSRIDENNERESGWILIYLLQGIWTCLGLVFVWLAWNTYHTYQNSMLIWSFVTTAVLLAACLGMWHTLICRRHYQRLLSSMQRSER